MEDRTIHAGYKDYPFSEPWYMNSHLVPIWLFLAVFILILVVSLITTHSDRKVQPS